MNKNKIQGSKHGQNRTGNGPKCKSEYGFFGLWCGGHSVGQINRLTTVNRLTVYFD